MNFTLLRQPFPFTDSLKMRVLQAFLFGFFIFLFLAVFQPFGLQSYRGVYKTLHFGAYGAITFIVLLGSHFLFGLLFPSWFHRNTWTVGKNLLYVLYMFFVIGIGNWALSAFLGFWGISAHTFLKFQFYTLFIGIFPVTISTLMIYQNRLKTALMDAQVLNQNIHAEHVPSVQHVQIPSKNKSEDINVALDSVLFIKAVENYVEVYLENEKIILRNTLIAVEDTLKDFQQFKRCHRSYVVNLHKIKSFSGNAQGLSLQFQAEGSVEIPVSRSYVPAIKAAL